MEMRIVHGYFNLKSGINSDCKVEDIVSKSSNMNAITKSTDAKHSEEH